MNKQIAILAGVAAVALAIVGLVMFTGSNTTGQATGVPTTSAPTSTATGGQIKDCTCSNADCENAKPFECPKPTASSPKDIDENPDANPARGLGS